MTHTFVRIALCRRVCSDGYKRCLLCVAYWTPMWSQLGGGGLVSPRGAH